jgi:hypothetical protein
MTRQTHTHTWLALTAVGCAVGASACYLAASNHPPPATAASAPPKEVSSDLKYSRVELMDHIATENAGYERGTELAGQLDPFQPVELNVDRGVCYHVALVLAEDSELSDHALHGIQIVATVDDKPVGTSFPHGPGGVAYVGCPSGAGLAKIDLQANWGSATDKSHLHDLGKGSFKAIVFTKPISDAELAARNEELRKNEEQQRAAQEEFNRQEEARRQAEADAAARSQASGGDQDPQACTRQCSSVLSLCQSKCGGDAGCRGQCQSSEWKCKDSCRAGGSGSGSGGGQDWRGCMRQCSSVLSLCQSNCGGDAGCRGQCQSSEWKCKDSCR